MPDIPGRLAELSADFTQGVALKEEEMKGFALYVSQTLQHFGNNRTLERQFTRTIFVPWLLGWNSPALFLPVEVVVAMTRSQITAAGYCLVINNLDYPGTRGAFRAIKMTSSPVEIQKHFLYQIFGFSGIAQKTLAYAADKRGVAAEQNYERLLIPFSNAGEEEFVGES